MGKEVVKVSKISENMILCVIGPKKSIRKFQETIDNFSNITGKNSTYKKTSFSVQQQTH